MLFISRGNLGARPTEFLDQGQLLRIVDGDFSGVHGRQPSHEIAMKIFTVCGTVTIALTCLTDVGARPTKFPDQGRYLGIIDGDFSGCMVGTGPSNRRENLYCLWYHEHCLNSSYCYPGLILTMILSYIYI